MTRPYIGYQNPYIGYDSPYIGYDKPYIGYFEAVHRLSNLRPSIGSRWSRFDISPGSLCLKLFKTMKTSKTPAADFFLHLEKEGVKGRGTTAKASAETLQRSSFSSKRKAVNTCFLNA